MVIRMKQTLQDKLKCYKTENDWTKYEAKKKENKDTINKLIEMVIINTALGVLLKSPSSFISLDNLYAAFYFRDNKNPYITPAFGEFYSYLMETGFYSIIIDVCKLLYIVSIAILFLYTRDLTRSFKKFLDNYRKS